MEDIFISRLKAGDYKAYKELLGAYEQKVFNTCLSFVPNTQDAEDIAQDVFIEVFKSIHSFKGHSTLSTWIYKISTNKSLDFIRKRKAQKRFSLLTYFSKDLESDNWLFVDFDHPGIALEQKEQGRILYKAIDALPENQRVIFTMNKIDGMSYKKIIELTGRTQSSVESVLFRAKSNLRKSLYDYYESLKK